MTHQAISFIKSAIRILGYFMLAGYHIELAAYTLVASEIIGVIEEIGHE